jgi:hypothetical protein
MLLSWCSRWCYSLTHSVSFKNFAASLQIASSSSLLVLSGKKEQTDVFLALNLNHSAVYSSYDIWDTHNTFTDCDVLMAFTNRKHYFVWNRIVVLCTRDRPVNAISWPQSNVMFVRPCHKFHKMNHSDGGGGGSCPSWRMVCFSNEKSNCYYVWYWRSTLNVVARIWLWAMKVQYKPYFNVVSFLEYGSSS